MSIFLYGMIWGVKRYTIVYKMYSDSLQKTCMMYRIVYTKLSFSLLSQCSTSWILTPSPCMLFLEANPSPTIYPEFYTEIEGEKNQWPIRHKSLGVSWGMLTLINFWVSPKRKMDILNFKIPACINMFQHCGKCVLDRTCLYAMPILHYVAACAWFRQ